MKRVLLALCLGLALSWLPSHAAALNNPWQIASTWGATNSQGPVELANNGVTEASVAWNPCPINMNSSFDLSFTMNFGVNRGLCGGDGMSFILQAATNGSPFNNGTAGVNGEKGFVGIPNSLEVAFDNYIGVAPPTGWPAYSNINILTNGDNEFSDTDVTGCGTQGGGPKVTGPCFPAASYIAPDIRDGLNHTVEIKWDPGLSLLTVIVDGNPSPPSWTLQTPSTYFGGQTSVYFGIGASSGGATNYQSFTYVGENGQSITCGAYPTPTAGAAPTPINYGTPACLPTVLNTFTPAPTSTPLPTATNTATPWPTVCGPTPAYAGSGGTLSSGNAVGGSAGMGCYNSPETWSLTTPAGSNQLLVISIYQGSTGILPTAIKYGGVNLTQKGTTTNNLSTWYLVNPPSGTNNIVFTVSGTQCSWGAAYSFYNNVNQATPFGNNSNTSHGGASTLVDTLTPSTGYSLIQDFVAANLSGGTLTTSMSGIWLPSSGIGGSYTLMGAYINSAGTLPVNFTYTYTQSDTWVDQMLEIMPITSCTTPSNTPSPTMTFTKTFTNTFTQTSTQSSTNTYTFTPTQSSTKTATNTFTQTSTRSSTNTYTLTPTQSYTKTATSSFTASPTPSSTPTPSLTPTQSSTKTATSTYTASPTPSFTPTPSLTLTQSSTKTATSTYTASPTPSFSPTQSFTPTQTATFTGSPTPTNSFTPSYTATVTASFSPSPTDSDTFTPSYTRTPTNTFTASPSFTSTRTPTPTRTPTNSFTVSPTVSQTSTITATPQPVPYQLKLSVFNSAGELVDLLYDGAAGSVPGSLDGLVSAFIEGQGGVTIPMGSAAPVVWTGLNSAGAYVTGGVYEIQAQIVDTFEQVTTLSHSVDVMAAANQQSIRIFNSAGELVRQLSLASPVVGAASLSLSSSSLEAASGGSPSPVVITVGTTGGGGSSLAWDGLNGAGLPVQSGVYTVLLVSTIEDQSAVVASRTLMVLKAPDPAGALESAYIAPNPATLPGPIWLFYNPAQLQGDWPRVELFDLSGERVAEADDPGMGGKIDVSAGRKLAGGIYLARFQLMHGDLLHKARTLKVAVAR